MTTKTKDLFLMIGVALCTALGTHMLVPANHAATISAVAPEAGPKEDRLQAILDAGVLKCAYIPYAPYLDIDPATGDISGVTADIMHAIAQKLNVRIAWTEEVGWSTMIEGLKASRYDAVCSAIWENTTRSVHASFSSPFGFSIVEAWTRLDDNRFDQGIKRINAADIKISTIDGELSATIAAVQFPKAQTVALSQNTPFSDLIMNVVHGKADVAFLDHALAIQFIEENPGTLKKIEAPRPITAFPITIMLPRDESSLKSVMDTAIQELLFTGEIDRILAKNNQDKSLFIQPTLPFKS